LVEVLGLLLTVGAIACMFADPHAERTDGKTGEAWVYIVCMMCSVTASFWVLINDELLKKGVPVFFNLLS